MYTMRPDQMLQSLASGIIELLIPKLPLEARAQADAIAATARHLAVGLPNRHLVAAEENAKIIGILLQACQVFVADDRLTMYEEMRSEIEALSVDTLEKRDMVELNERHKGSLERVIQWVESVEDLGIASVRELEGVIATYLRWQIDRDLALYDAAFTRGWRSHLVAPAASSSSAGA